MISRASAFAVLGLKPGADPAAVEEAYKRLIKQHHPDREGGDGTRAAEIIHAYRLLRGGTALTNPLQFNDPVDPRRGRRRWPAALAFALIGLAASAFILGPNLRLEVPAWLPGADLPVRSANAPVRRAADPMSDPLNLRTIDAAIAEVRQMYRAKDQMALAAASRACYGRFRSNPTTKLFDRCAAFDNAVVGLQDRDPLRDGGPFAPLAVTGRQFSAASTLSSDYLAIDSRLAQIRIRVELALAPRDPLPAIEEKPSAASD